MGSELLQIAGTIHDSIVDGPGLRFTVFAQGCLLACTGCHNPETQPRWGGRTVDVTTLIGELESNPLTTGLTLTGGEPTLQAGPCAALAEAARQRGLDVWCWSGYRVEALLRKAPREPALRRLIAAIDVLVDGPYVHSRRTLGLPWRGSTNQRLIDAQASLTVGRAVEIRHEERDADPPSDRAQSIC